MISDKVFECKKQGEELVDTTCACKFCGQIGIYKLPYELSDEEQNEYATEVCGCGASGVYTTRKRKVERAEEALKDVAGPESNIKISDKNYDMAFNAIKLMVHEDLEEFTIRDKNGIKLKMKKNSKGNVIITSSFNVVQSKEA